MSGMARFDTLYRDSENGILLGVCAGIADSLDMNVLVIRLLALVVLIVFFVPTAVLYLTAGLLLRERPLNYRGTGDERWFWSRGQGES